MVEPHEEPGARKQVGTASRAQPKRLEDAPNRGEPCLPSSRMDAALVQEFARSAPGQREAGRASAVQDVGVFRGRDEGHEGLDHRGIAIRCRMERLPQRGDRDLAQRRKPSCRFTARTLGAMSLRDALAMAHAIDRRSENRCAPARSDLAANGLGRRR